MGNYGLQDFLSKETALLATLPRGDHGLPSGLPGTLHALRAQFDLNPVHAAQNPSISEWEEGRVEVREN